jgi:hypothetical protein
MVDDDRSRSVSDVHSSAIAGPLAGSTQTASFAIGALQLELTAAPGAAALVVVAGETRDVYALEASALAGWAAAVARLLSLTPAETVAQRVEYRAPFLIDREGRESIAVEALVTEQAVNFRLLVSGAAGRVAGLMTTPETVRGIAEAATGAVAVANTTVRR